MNPPVLFAVSAVMTYAEARALRKDHQHIGRCPADGSRIFPVKGDIDQGRNLYLVHFISGPSKLIHGNSCAFVLLELK